MPFDNPNEKLYRMVYADFLKRDNFGNVTGISKAAFKRSRRDRESNTGISVFRAGGRESGEVKSEINRIINKTSSVISVTVNDCNNVEIHIEEKPSEFSKFHSELWGLKEPPVKDLSDRQMVYLSNHYELE